jgi:hypothetical protein
MATPASPRKTLARFATPLFALAALGAAVSAQARPPLVCGDILFQSVTLTDNLICGPGQDGLTIGADGVRIDLNGFTIEGTADPATAGVSSRGFNGVEIVGPGRIQGFEWAAFLGEGHGHRVKGIETRSGNVLLYDSSDSTVERNRLSGLGVMSSPTGRATGNLVSGNELTPNWAFPAYAYGMVVLSGCGTAENLVTGNSQPLAPNPDQGSSVILMEGAHDNTISRNTLTRRLFIGGAASANVVSGNVISVDVDEHAGVELGTEFSNCAGGVFVGPRKNMIVENEINEGAYGIFVHGGFGVAATRNTFRGNVISNPKYAGIWFGYLSDGNDGRKNKVIGRIPYAIDDGTGNLWP